MTSTIRSMPCGARSVTRVLEAGEARVVTISQSYDTDAADLWDACTNIERIPRWFLPITGDLQVGGQYQLEGNANGTILTCDPPRAFTATWEYGGDVSWIEVQHHQRGPRPVTLRTGAHRARRRRHWEQFGPGAVGMGWDWALVGLAIHLSTGEAVDPSFGQQWMASEDGRRFMKLSGEAWYEANVAGGADPDGGPGRRGSVRRRPTSRRQKLEHVLASRACRRYSRGDACPDTCPDRVGDARPGRHREARSPRCWAPRSGSACPTVHFGPDTCTYRGRPADFVADIALSYAGEIQLELIAPVKGESVYTEFLDARRPGSAPHLRGGRRHRRPSTPRCATPSSGDTPVVQQGVDAGRYAVRLRLRRAGRRALHRDRTHPARDPGVLRLRQTGATVTTEIPETVDAADVTNWSDEVDVVVIGFGIAGGCAAVSAAAAGARVLVLERAAAAGGTTSMAGGHFYLGGGTAVQQATGHPDSPEEMYKYLVAVSRDPEHDKIRAYCEGSVEHFNWLEDLGFQFERSYYPGKVVVPPGTEGLSYTGNEKVWPFTEQAKPAPRGHSVPVPGELGGAAMVIDLLVKRADELGVQVRYETGVTNLVVDDGAVVGVSWKHFSETGAIKAKAVIIAAGGFAMNPEMVAEHTPALGQKRRTKHHGVGGALHSGQPQRRRSGHPDGCLGGRRRQEPGPDVHHRRRIPAGDSAHRHHRQQPGPALRGRGLLSLTHVGLRAGATGPGGVSHRRRGTHGNAAAAADPVHRRLGDRRGDGAGARNSRGQAGGYSEPVQRECGTRRGSRTSTSSRNTLRRKILGRGRRSICRWAGRCTPGSPWAGWPSPSTARCCGRTAATIPGLYAAGACASNIAQDGKGYASGTQLGEGSFFGRRAGAHAAQAARPAPVARRPGRAATRRRPATADAARGAARRWGGG